MTDFLGTGNRVSILVELLLLLVILSIDFVLILVELLLDVCLSGLHGCLYVHHVETLPTHHVLRLPVEVELVLTVLTRLELEALLVTARVALRELLTVQAHLHRRVALQLAEDVLHVAHYHREVHKTVLV